MRLVFHLGYQRTGTTFLQTHIFPKHKQINFLGPKNYLNWQNVKIDQKTLNTFKNSYFLKNKNDFENSVVKHFDKEKINVISTERYLSYRNAINNFYDCKYIEELFNGEDLEVSFLIILRNQYDLIRSLYYHTYPEIIKFLKIKNFENLVNQIDDGVIDNINNFPLRLFLEQYDFNLIDVRLKELFKNSKVKYLFYEDLKYNKNIFIDEFCKFLNLDLTYTQNLFNDNDKIVNPRKFDKKNELVISPLKYKIINNKIFIALKNKIPFKEIFKSIFLKYFVYSKVEKIYDENRLKYIIKKYYKNSNRIFFKNIKINNKFDY